MTNIFDVGYVVACVATFGDNLKRLRERAGFLTSKSLADALGVNPSVVSKMENNLQGLPETPTLLRLAKVLKATVEELLEGVDAEYDAINRARTFALLEVVLPKLSVLEMALKDIDPLDEDDEQARRRLARLKSLAGQARLLRLVRDAIAHNLVNDVSVFDSVLKEMEENITAAGLSHITDPDDVSEIIDVGGYKRDDVPVIAEGDATPEPNLFWDDKGILLSEVEDRVTRPHEVTDPRAYGVRVRGDSMITRLQPGDVAIVSPNSPAQDGDEVYAQLLSGERLLKVAHKIPGGWLLESYNRAYEPRQVKKSEIGAMHPILWIRSKRRGRRLVAERTQ